jgi:hypothetical protein
MDIVKPPVGHYQNQIPGFGLLDQKFDNGVGVSKKMGILAAQGQISDQLLG